jgi:hypothetical protein
VIEPILPWLVVPPIKAPSGRALTRQGYVMALLFAALVLGFIASAVGIVGGLAGGALAHMFRRWRHHGGPPTPAGVS